VSAGGAQQGSTEAPPNSRAAAHDAALEAYRSGKRSMVTWSLIAGASLGLVVAAGSRQAALTFATGVACGLANSLLSMYSSERLAVHRGVAPFVLSSVVRIVVFGILPVGLTLGLSLHGPWWTLAAYFAGFFTPLALFALRVARTPRTN
jgi:hypothetical protein